MFIETLATVTKIKKQPKYISTNEWKKKEILKYVMTWMDPEVVLLSEVSQTKTNTV